GVRGQPVVLLESALRVAVVLEQVASRREARILPRPFFLFAVCGDAQPHPHIGGASLRGYPPVARRDRRLRPGIARAVPGIGIHPQQLVAPRLRRLLDRQDAVGIDQALFRRRRQVSGAAIRSLHAGRIVPAPGAKLLVARVSVLELHAAPMRHDVEGLQQKNEASTLSLRVWRMTASGTAGPARFCAGSDGAARSLGERTAATIQSRKAAYSARRAFWLTRLLCGVDIRMRRRMWEVSGRLTSIMPPSRREAKVSASEGRI